MQVTVYEAVNKTLHEAYLGGSKLPLAQLQVRHLAVPPSPIAHWDFKSHNISYNEIEHSLPDHDIGLFIESYDLSTPMPGWKVYKERCQPSQ